MGSFTRNLSRLGGQVIFACTCPPSGRFAGKGEGLATGQIRNPRVFPQGVILG
jgi:hypothetical protein